MNIKTYTVTNTIAFAALRLPFPANSIAFWAPKGAPGALLIPGEHFLTYSDNTFVLGPLALSVGDRISVVTVQ